MIFSKYTSIFFLMIVLTACAAHRVRDESHRLASVTIIDRNGFNETVSTEDRLEQYEAVNFLKQTPYEKVTRVYGRDLEGNVPAIITSYHPNGQPKQYLEVVNGRALGQYQEWHQNGNPKLSANVIGGIGDIESGAESSWLFEGMSQAWDEEGNLLAEIPYQKGLMEGTALYYHNNGKLWREVPYHQNNIDGTVKTYTEDQRLLQSNQYTEGLPNGTSLRYWNNGSVASKEEFSLGKLLSADYYDQDGKEIGSVKDGKGIKILFGKNGIAETHVINNGVQHGEVKIYDSAGNIVSRYHSFEGVKKGEEIIYYEKGTLTQPKISIYWQDGIIHGTVKTWYPNGTQESSREFTQNKKNGLSTAWYADGSVMLIEEYENDLLVNGEYYRRRDKSPVSKVKMGEGTATLFDADGQQLHRVTYREGTVSL